MLDLLAKECRPTYLNLESPWQVVACNLSANSAINDVVKSIWAKHWLGRVAGVNWCASQLVGWQVAYMETKDRGGASMPWSQVLSILSPIHANICIVVHCRHEPNCRNKPIICLYCAGGANESKPINVPRHTSPYYGFRPLVDKRGASIVVIGESSQISCHTREQCSNPVISCL